jgi:hypothetical protein
MSPFLQNVCAFGQRMKRNVYAYHWHIKPNLFALFRPGHDMKLHPNHVYTLYIKPITTKQGCGLGPFGLGLATFHMTVYELELGTDLNFSFFWPIAFERFLADPFRCSARPVVFAIFVARLVQISDQPGPILTNF